MVRDGLDLGFVALVVLERDLPLGEPLVQVDAPGLVGVRGRAQCAPEGHERIPEPVIGKRAHGRSPQDAHVLNHAFEIRGRDLAIVVDVVELEIARQLLSLELTKHRDSRDEGVHHLSRAKSPT